MEIVDVVRLGVALWTYLARLRLAGTCELGGHYSGGDGDDPIAEYHDDRREKFPEARLRRKISVPTVVIVTIAQ